MNYVLLNKGTFKTSLKTKDFRKKFKEMDEEMINNKDISLTSNSIRKKVLNNHYLYLTIKNDKIIGFVLFNKKKEHYYISDVTVFIKYRRQHICSNMIKNVVIEIFYMNKDKDGYILLDVKKDNKGIKCYLDNGFKIYNSHISNKYGEEYELIFKLSDVNDMMDFISKNISKYIKYPYLKNTITKSSLLELFNKLKGSELTDYVIDYDMSSQNTHLKDKKRLILEKAFIVGDEYEILMDYFQEPVRVICNREGMISPWESYITPEYNKKWVRKHFKSILNTDDIHSELRSSLQTIYKKDCDAFPANLALWLFRKWKPTKILMMSGAWGDEIIATMAYENHSLLTAVDPNTDAVKNWYKMMKFFDKKSTKKYKFHIAPFEDVKLDKTENKFDLMYSSPPYFCAEHYSNNENQSYLKFESLDSWINGFLTISLTKVWSLLNDNGVVILALNDVKIGNDIHRIVQPMHDVMDSLPNSKYIGTWGFKKYKTQYNYQPLFCWRKSIIR